MGETLVSPLTLPASTGRICYRPEWVVSLAQRHAGSTRSRSVALRSRSPISILGAGLPASHSRAVGRLVQYRQPSPWVPERPDRITHAGRWHATDQSARAKGVTARPGTGPRERSYHLASNRDAVGAVVTRDCWGNSRQDRYPGQRHRQRRSRFEHGTSSAFIDMAISAASATRRRRSLTEIFPLWRRLPLTAACALPAAV